MLRAVALAVSLPCSMIAQDAALWQPAPAFPLPVSPLAITQRAQPHLPFTVAGEHGAIFGQQDGTFEVWKFPDKIASHFRITAALADYPVPIDLNEYAATIEVDPDRTTVTYSHAAFTVKQHMFAVRGGTSPVGAVVFFEIRSIRPLELTIRFTPEMLHMWPASNFNPPNAEWVAANRSGYYVLHTDSDRFSGFVGMPGAVPGILAPYQERPRTYPPECKFAFDPHTQANTYFPLLFAGSAS